MKRKLSAKKKPLGKSEGAPRARNSRTAVATIAAAPKESDFREVVALIERARARAFQAVNTELIDLYWRVGELISRKLETAAWGDGVVDDLARYLKRRHPEMKGFTRRNLFRMRQFFAAYRHEKKVSALVTQLPWTQNLLILARAKRPEEREFYLRIAVREKWSSRELERQDWDERDREAWAGTPFDEACLDRSTFERLGEERVEAQRLAAAADHADIPYRGLLAHILRRVPDREQRIRILEFYFRNFSENASK